MEKTSDSLVKNKVISPHFILENIGELILIFNTSSQILYASPSYCQLFCKEKRQLTGEDYDPIIHEDDIAISEASMRTLELHPHTCYIERREKTIHGWRWLAWSNKAVIGVGGVIDSIVCVGRDITDKRLSEERIKRRNTENEVVAKELRLQKFNYEKIAKELVKRNNKINELYEELRDSEGRFRNMFEKHSTVMLLIDPESYNIIDANLAAQHYYGYSEDEFATKNLKDIYLEPLEKVFRKVKKANKSKKKYITTTHRLANGKKRDVEVHTVSIIYEKEEVIFSIVHDITSRVKTKIKLEKSEAKLREANYAKDKFFSIIAHDLKNPFNAILGLSDYIISNFTKLSEDKIIDFVENINKVSNQTYNLLENLLQWAKAQLGKLEVNIEAVALNEIINEEVHLIKNTANSKELNIIVVLEEEYHVYADKNMIATVIRNLITNAIKFSYRGGKIIVFAEKTNSNVKISVIDEGAGMSDKTLKKIFDIDSTKSTTGTENEKGTGLGLIICKEFVENCKGKIGVESTEGAGSLFHFELPQVK